MKPANENRISLDGAELDARAVEQFEAYLALLVKWNARMNLTAVRTPEEIVRRHFAESIFAAQQIPKQAKTLLDFGSGAGFPGIPIAICRPKIGVTLAESQGKKATFLREVVRTLGLKAEVWPGRVEEMAGERVFDAVTLRAVDKMASGVQGGGQSAGDGRMDGGVYDAEDGKLAGKAEGDPVGNRGGDSRLGAGNTEDRTQDLRVDF